MKRIVALILALILVMSIVTTCLAAHKHKWVYAHPGEREFVGEAILPKTVNKCSKCSHQHTHEKRIKTYAYEQVCSCGETRWITRKEEGPWVCLGN